MTIRLLATYRQFKPNTNVTLASGTEAALVAGGNATTDLSGGVPYDYKLPANTRQNAIAYGTDGVPLGFSDSTGKIISGFSGISAPGAPTGLTLTAIAGGVLATMTAPASTGGTATIGYEVTLSTGQVQLGETTTVTVNAPAGVAVTATAKAINGYDKSVASSASASVTPTTFVVPTTPGAPTGLTLTAGNGKVTASWTAAASNGSAIRDTIVTLSNGASATALGSATTVEVATPNDVPVTATARANNGEGAGPASGVSNSVTPTTVSAPAPVFTAPPVLPNLPTAGTALTATPGTYTGTATIDSLTIVKLTEDGPVDVGLNYVPTVNDLQFRFIARHTVSSTGGADIATSISRPGVQTVGLQPSFNQSTDPANATTGVTGLPVNPYIMALDAPEGYRVKMWLGQRTAGATVSIAWQVETGVGTNVYAAGGGTNGVTTGNHVYTWYQPANGEAGRRLRAVCTLGGTGSNPQPPYTTTPVMIVAAVAATGKVRTVAVFNRIPLAPQIPALANDIRRRVLSNMRREIGSGPITHIRPRIPNYITDGGTGNNAPGNPLRVQGVDFVYNGVVIPFRVGGVAPTEGTPLLVPNGGYVDGDEIAVSAFGLLPYIPAGESVLCRMKIEVQIGDVFGRVEASDAGGAEHIYLIDSSTIVNDIGNTNSGNNYELSATNSTSAQEGPAVLVFGKFACGDPKTVGCVRDSKGATGSSFHVSLVGGIPGKAKFAGLNISRSGGNSGFFTGSTELQSYAQFAWVWVPGMGVNAVQDTANFSNARGLDTANAAIWTGLNTYAATGAGVHPLVIVQSGIDYHFKATNPSSGLSYNTLISSRQTPFIPFDINGDIDKYFVPAMKAAVAAGTIAAYVDHRKAYSLSQDETSPLYLKGMQTYVADGLHFADYVPGARVDRKIVDAIV